MMEVVLIAFVICLSGGCFFGGYYVGYLRERERAELDRVLSRHEGYCPNAPHLHITECWLCTYRGDE